MARPWAQAFLRRHGDLTRRYPCGIIPLVIHRAAVLFDTPQALAACRTVRRLGSWTGCRVRRGRPSRLPCRLARAKPAVTRSEILARSNSARAAKICSCSLPAGVVQSIPSPRLTNATPKACSSSSNVTRCFRLRPKRSSRQQIKTSNRRRRASRSRSSRAGRRSLAPLMPSARGHGAGVPGYRYQAEAAGGVEDPAGGFDGLC